MISLELIISMSYDVSVLFMSVFKSLHTHECNEDRLNNDFHGNMVLTRLSSSHMLKTVFTNGRVLIKAENHISWLIKGICQKSIVWMAFKRPVELKNSRHLKLLENNSCTTIKTAIETKTCATKTHWHEIIQALHSYIFVLVIVVSLMNDVTADRSH